LKGKWEKKEAQRLNSKNNKCWNIKLKKIIKKGCKKKKQSQPMLTFEIHDRGHKTMIDSVEGKIKKKITKKNSKNNIKAWKCKLKKKLSQLELTC